MLILYVFTESLSRESFIAIIAASVFAFSVVLGVCIGVLCVLGCQRCRRSDHRPSKIEIEMKKPVEAVYEDPDNVKPRLNIQGNVSYGHPQPKRYEF